MVTEQQDVIVGMLRNELQGGTDLVYQRDCVFLTVPSAACLLQVLLLSVLLLYIDVEGGCISLPERTQPLPGAQGIVGAFTAKQKFHG